MHKNTKRTKVVATIGPKTESVEVMTKLVHAGLNVIRLNMSHGDHDEHSIRISNARKVEKNLSVHLPILLDLSGPKIRTGEYTTPTINIKKGAGIILTADPVIGDEKRIHINYSKLPKEVKKGSIIMLDDGKKKLADIKGNIYFENVSFSYENNIKILDSITVKIDSGETVALVGASGSGKTTFLNFSQQKTFKVKK